MNRFVIVLGSRLWCALNIKEVTAEVYITFNGRIFASFLVIGSKSFNQSRAELKSGQSCHATLTILLGMMPLDYSVYSNNIRKNE